MEYWGGDSYVAMDNIKEKAKIILDSNQERLGVECNQELSDVLKQIKEKNISKFEWEKAY